jgi:hypothetical protein
VCRGNAAHSGPGKTAQLVRMKLEPVVAATYSISTIILVRSMVSVIPVIFIERADFEI